MVGPSKHTHTHGQCSHTSVGLTQARPNNLLLGGVDGCLELGLELLVRVRVGL